MVKDKLVKTNHKAAFYRLRKCAIIGACFFFGAVAVALPVSLTLNDQNKATVRAEEPSSSELSEETTNSEELLTTY